MKKELSFENAMNRLEEIVSLLEKGDTTLDDSLKLYEEGEQLAKLCNKKLTEAEQKISTLVGAAEEKQDA